MALSYTVGSGYFTTIGIGRPPQYHTFRVDTEATRTWVKGIDMDPLHGHAYKKSSSLSRLGRFEDKHWGVSGKRISDNVILTGFNTSFALRMIIGYGSRGTASYSILGMGAYHWLNRANFMRQLKRSKLINKSSFALHANMVNVTNASSHSGYNSSIITPASMLFDGVDHAKYSGRLLTVPMAHKKNFAVMVESIDIDFIGNSSSGAVPLNNKPFKAILASASNYSTFPSQLGTSFKEILQAETAADGTLHFQCGMIERIKRVFLNFGAGHRFEVPLENLYIKSPTDGECQTRFRRGCTSKHGLCKLGAGFMDPLYIVYNVDDSEISIGQANNTSKENIEKFQRFIPGAVRLDGKSPKSNAGSIVEPSVLLTMILPFVLLVIFIG